MTPAAIPLDNVPDWVRARLERQIDMLGELAEAGLAMALDVKDEAQALKQAGGVEPAVLEGLSRAFGRTARAVRLTLMLQERLIKGLVAFDARGCAATLEGDHGPDDERRVVRIIIDPRGDLEDGERLVREGAERLDHEDLENALLSRPVDEQAAAIRRDLGLDAEPLLPVGEAGLRQKATSGAAGWPLPDAAAKSSPSRLGASGRSRGRGIPDAAVLRVFPPPPRCGIPVPDGQELKAPPLP